MGKVVKHVLVFALLLLTLVCSFIAGDYLNLNITSILGLHPHIAEPLPETEPYIADEAIVVETLVPIDDTGSGEIEITQQKVPYVIDVDFAPVLLKEAQLEKKLVIMSQRATASETATKAGLWKLSVFKQTKAIIFHGEGTYYVDLSSLTSDDSVIDNDKKEIIIYIPKPQLSVKLVPEETEFFAASNGTFRFGEMEITPEAMTTLETQGKSRITEILESDRNSWDTAIRFAKLSVKEIYEPIVTAQINAALKKAADEYAIPPIYTIIVEVKDD